MTLLDNHRTNHQTGYTSHTYATEHGWSADVSVEPELYKDLHAEFEHWGQIESFLEKVLVWVVRLRLGRLIRFISRIR